MDLALRHMTNCVCFFWSLNFVWLHVHLQAFCKFGEAWCNWYNPLRVVWKIISYTSIVVGAPQLAGPIPWTSTSYLAGWPLLPFVLRNRWDHPHNSSILLRHWCKLQDPVTIGTIGSLFLCWQEKGGPGVSGKFRCFFCLIPWTKCVVHFDMVESEKYDEIWSKDLFLETIKWKFLVPLEVP